MAFSIMKEEALHMKCKAFFIENKLQFFKGTSHNTIDIMELIH